MTKIKDKSAFLPLVKKENQSNMRKFDAFILIYSRFPNKVKKKKFLGSGGS